MATKKEPKSAEPSAPAPALVRFRNAMTQKLVVTIRDRTGIFHSEEVRARGSFTWPALDDYGPHVKSLTRARRLILSPA